MTTPDTADDVVSACLAMLRQVPQLVVVFANPADPGDPLITDRAPLREEMPGATALVISNLGPWSAPSTQHTDDSVRLQAELWADPIPDSTVEPSECRRRLEHAWSALDEVLHRVGGEAQWWGAIRTIDCVRLARVSAYEVPDSGGLWRGTAVYGVGLG